MKNPYVFYGVLVLLGLLISFVVFIIAPKHISDAEADESCESCRWLHRRADRTPCCHCNNGSHYDKSALEGQELD
jgi:uncharacterized paraquat-inducible protein A